MDANQRFVKLLRSIENSNLNYSMTTTPFSATISLKNSLIKRFKEASTAQENQNVNYTNEQVKNLEIKLNKVEAENLKLKSDNKDLETTAFNYREKFEEASFQLQKLFETEKENSKEFDKKTGDFREDLLKVKSEKHDLKTDVKTLTDLCDALKMERTELKEENEMMKNLLNDKMKVLNENSIKLTEEREQNESLKKVLVDVKSELDQSILNEQKKTEIKIKCNECATIVQGHDELKQHITSYHCHNKSSQYDVYCFEEYQCFYCDEYITSEENLEDHRTVCDEVLNVLLSTDVTLFACPDCGAECTDFEDLGRHMKTYHESLSEEPRDKIFYCDVCPLYFESEINLQFHKRGCHWDHMGFYK